MTLAKLTHGLENVVEVTSADKSYLEVKGIHIKFSNGYTLSIMCGRGCYSESDSYEVAVLKNDKLDYTHTGGDIMGYQSREDVRALAVKISHLTVDAPALES